MLWPCVSLRVAVLCLALTLGPPGIRAEGNVGCLFGEKLCLDEEWCYDDMAFGRCLKPLGDVDEENLYRFDLERQSLHEISAELRRLFALGYRWSHGYTQCRLQTMLYAVKNDLIFEPDSCFHLSDNDLESALKAIEGQVELDPQEVAIIKYTPSVDDPYASYADEVYFPPLRNRPQDEIRERILPSNAVDLDIQDPYADYAVLKRSWIPQMRRRSLPTDFRDLQSFDFRHQKTDDGMEFLRKDDQDDGPFARKPSEVHHFTSEDMPEIYPMIKFLNEMNLTPRDVHNLLQHENADQLEALMERFDSRMSTGDAIQNVFRNQLELKKQSRLADDSFNLNYNTPDNFREGWESRDTGRRDPDYFPESRMYYEENEEDNSEYGSGHPEVAETIFRERLNDGRIKDVPLEKQLGLDTKFNGRYETDERRVIPGVYSEGGVVYTAPNEYNGQEADGIMFKDSLDSLLQKYRLGFKRPERLDVKKPGPPFDTQITESPQKAEGHKHAPGKIVAIPSMTKKGPPGAHPYPEYEQRVDNTLNYVYVGYERGLEAWKQGDRIVGNISSLLHLESTAFIDGRTDPYALHFKVRPNSRGLNAIDVAKRIELLKDKIGDITGVKITSVGIGDSKNEQQVLFKHLTDDSQYDIVMYSIFGALAAVLVASVVLFFIVRHIKSREKLQNIARPDTEASNDYQDLCRARMATKSHPAGDHGKIASLSKECEQSPSSRSSTSSWSEEPALHNMDISTGHMVLTYMEDHLKNKDRLEQEWVALCAYVAEPCDTTVAKKKENKDKNRCPDVVPYDHARVLLNALTNAHGSDYINASSITDHDPRNPAYIATHGPLPHTVPEFWQLIWEQGAVVIVMLTRLTEGGSAMCHRYWPEEGSELYHIYEVHLVSEHIWCDDYLVRSFYLKNMKTGETRTVTQFHFLSWSEGGVPSSTKALLEFRRKVNKSYRGRSCPIVVHCSDGAGRTGTYCLIDMVLSRMAKGAKEIDIAATLEHLRDQRPKMVGTKQQFEFVLTAVAEEVHAILKALPPQPSSVAGPEKEK